METPLVPATGAIKDLRVQSNHSFFFFSVRRHMGVYGYGQRRPTESKIFSIDNQRWSAHESDLLDFVASLTSVPITFHGDTVQYAALEEAVTIKCHVQASPAAEVSWFKGREKTRIGLLPSRAPPGHVFKGVCFATHRWALLHACP